MRTWSAVLASAFLCALATEASAQNMDEMMRRMQQMMQQSQAVRAAEREWANLPSDERACLTRKLEEQGDTISALTRRGILPSEARFAEMLQKRQPLLQNRRLLLPRKSRPRDHRLIRPRSRNQPPHPRSQPARPRKQPLPSRVGSPQRTRRSNRRPS